MKRLFLLTTSLIFSLLAMSCGNSIDDMLSNYNNQFSSASTKIKTDSTSEESNEVPEPGDPDFKEENMLFDNYVLSHVSTLNLSAPNNCYSYTWQMFDPDSEEEVELNVRLMTGYSQTTKRYVLYVPTSNLYANKTFKLKLQVHGKDGYTYEDTCGVAVYKNYFFTGGFTSQSVTDNTKISLDNAQDESKNISTCARTILPEAYKVTDSSLVYYIYAENDVTGAVIGPQLIDVEADTLDTTGSSGTLLISFPPSSYHMALYCLSAESSDTRQSIIASQAVLVGYSNADLRYSEDVNFNMTTESLTTAGHGDLKIYTKGWSLSDYSGYSVSAEIVNTDGTRAAAGYNTELSDSNLGDNEVPSSVNLSFNIENGTYLLKVHFTNGTDTYTWSDTIVILAGKSTVSSLGVPLVIDTTGGSG